MGYDLERLEELIELCKIEPREFKLTEKTIYRYNYNQKNLLTYLTREQHIDLLQQTYSLIEKDVYVDGNIVIFFRYLLLRNGEDTRAFMILISLLELLKDRFNERIMRAWIYKVSTDYVNYLEVVNPFHDDLEEIYGIKISNREDYTGFLEEIADILQTDTDTIYRIPFEAIVHDDKKENSKIISGVTDYLSGKTSRLNNYLSISNVHGLFPSIAYYIVRDIIYKDKEYNSEYIERIISGMEEIINYYIEKFPEFHPSSYVRITTLIAAKNSIKIRYNMDNDLWTTEELITDYTDELQWVYLSKLHYTSSGITIKLLQEIYKLQLIYNAYDIPIDIYNIFEDVYLSLLNFASIDIKNIEEESKQLYILEVAIPGFGVNAFFPEKKGTESFNTAYNNYFNLFNDGTIHKHNEYRDFDMGFVYSMKEDNGTD